MQITSLEGFSVPSELLLPIFVNHVAAGFPSPADDYVEDRIDLNSHIVKRPTSTFFARANGRSLVKKGIFDGDLLVIDRSANPVHGSIVIAAIDGDMTCKILDQHRRQLVAANPQFSPIPITDETELLIEGVVTHSIRYHNVRAS